MNGSNLQGSIFPKDIYPIILDNVDDLKTLGRCAQVCKYFNKKCDEIQDIKTIWRVQDVGRFETLPDGSIGYARWEIKHDLQNLKHGHQCEWYPNGQLRMCRNYNHGKLEGDSYYYRRNGEIESIITYSNDEVINKRYLKKQKR